MSHIDYFSAYRSGVRKVATIVPTAVELYMQGFLKQAEVPPFKRSVVTSTVTPRTPWARSFSDLSAYPGRPVPGENRQGQTITYYTPPANSRPGFRRLAALKGNETNAQMDAYLRALAEQNAGDRGSYRTVFTPPRVTENSRVLSQSEGDAIFGPVRPPIQTRVGEVTQVPGGTVGEKPLPAGVVFGPDVKTPHGGYRKILNSTQQTDIKPPELRATPPELRPDSAPALEEPPAALAVSQLPGELAQPTLGGRSLLSPETKRESGAEFKRDNPELAKISPSKPARPVDISPDMNTQFKRFHGTKFDPTSRVDREKLTKLPPISAKPEPISSAKNTQFKDYHGTKFDPTSRVDREKLTKLPPISTFDTTA